MLNDSAPQLSIAGGTHLGRDDDYEEFCTFLEATCGITLGNNKRYLVDSRLRAMLDEYRFGSLRELVRAARSETGNHLKVRIINAMATNETSWFRDIYPFEYLQDVILPDLARNPATVPKIWSAACSYGHEPYSISISVQEFLDKNPGLLPGGVEITGTDISTRALEQARTAEYDELNLSRGLSAERLARYFTVHGNRLRVSDPVRHRVRFLDLNLLRNYSLLGKFDVIFCRNVLIYFSNENKSQILSKIEAVMKPAAWLFLGASEPIINYSDAFEMINCSRGVVYRKKT